MSFRLPPLLLLGLLAAWPPLPSRAEEEDPYYFADDTLDLSERDRQARTLRAGPRTFSKDEPERDTPEYRKERAPLKELKYLAPGNYEAKIVGILCNACTDSVLEELKRIPQIGKASFDYEEGVLRFAVRQAKPEDKKAGDKTAKRPRFFLPGKDAPLRFSRLRRAVVRAGRRVNLDSRFTISEVKRTR